MNEEQLEENLVNEFRNGKDAKILKNGLENLLAMYKAELFNDLIATDADEKDKREEAYRQLKTVEYVEGKLIKAIQTGEMAKQQLSAMDKAKQLMNNMIG